MKRIPAIVEAVFDILYLGTGLVIGLVLLCTAGERTPRLLAGIMALVLAGGDAFHLVPRIRVILTGDGKGLKAVLGRGKQITSITMTLFYLLLWNIGLIEFSPANSLFWSVSVYILASVRILLCLMPQNRWSERYSPQNWTIWRNIPFVLQGIMVAGLFFVGRNIVPGIRYMYLAIILSFAFYLPVVFWSNRNPKVGMLMLPKSCAYLWMLVIALAL